MTRKTYTYDGRTLTANGWADYLGLSHHQAVSSRLKAGKSIDEVVADIITRRHRIYYTYDGQTMTATEWAKWLGVKMETVRLRLDIGMSIEDTIHAIQAGLLFGGDGRGITPKIEEQRRANISAGHERRRLQRVAELEAILGSIEDGCDDVSFENAMKLYRAGLTGVEIAIRWCISESRVWQLLNQNPDYKELAADRLYYYQTYKESLRTSARHFHHQGERLSAADVGKRLGLSHGTVNWRLANGWSEEDAISLTNQHNTILEHEGSALTVKEWAARLQITESTLRERLNEGWPIEKALTSTNQKNQHISFDGLTLTLPQWAERIGIDKRVLWARLHKQKWTVKKALTTPATKGHRFITHDGKTLHIAQWARLTGIHRTTITDRLDKQKLSVEQALT